MSLVDMSEQEDNKLTSREEMWIKMASELYPNLRPSEALNAFFKNKKQFEEFNSLFDKEFNRKTTEIKGKEVFVHCPGCGYGFAHELLSDGKH